MDASPSSPSPFPSRAIYSFFRFDFPCHIHPNAIQATAQAGRDGKRPPCCKRPLACLRHTHRPRHTEPSIIPGQDLDRCSHTKTFAPYGYTITPTYLYLFVPRNGSPHFDKRSQPPPRRDKPLSIYRKLLFVTTNQPTSQPLFDIFCLPSPRKRNAPQSLPA